MLTLISGPCSAETKDQLFQTAEGVAKAGIKILRAGVWKPRTRPGNFEGCGEEALQWMALAKEQFGLKLATEVATLEHIELATQYGVDIAWLGARTTTSPFTVEQLAPALASSGMEVYVKNPICAELDLWIGAIERLQRAGVSRLTAIHRGFVLPVKDIYRNEPLWSIPLALKNYAPNLPVICDPSHIAGKWEYVSQLCYMALSLGMDGLMIESHNSPYHALSDGRQQLSPGQLAQLMEDLRRDMPHRF